jgi:hypothetical protein
MVSAAPGNFFPDRQELAVAQTACRSSKNTLARPPCGGKLAETMIKAERSLNGLFGRLPIGI